MKKMLLMAMAMGIMTSCGAAVKRAEEGEKLERLRSMRASSVVPVGTELEEDRGRQVINYCFQKGIWLSYVDLAPMLSTDDEDELERRFSAACQEISDLGCNTVYFHVRAFGDALYKSELYPPAESVMGDLDPLDIFCRTAHSYGLSVHAWINPLRLQGESELGRTDEKYQTARWYKEDSGQVRTAEGSPFLWLDPAYPEVRELIAEGAAEIVKNYPVDGIHYDDYFYPTTDEEFDRESFEKMSGGRELSRFRLDNTDLMCREIYSQVKAAAPEVKVGISPQGNTWNDLNVLYADVGLWCREEGRCDYIMPQIYFGYDDPVKPFSSTLAEWTEMCRSGTVDLCIGLGAYKISSDGEFQEDSGIIARQIGDCTGAENCQGVSLYGFSALFAPENGSEKRAGEDRKLIKDALSAAGGDR